MAEILAEILIVAFNVLLLGGIVWTLFWRNPRKLSPRQIAAINEANAHAAANLPGSSRDYKMPAQAANLNETSERVCGADGANLKDASGVKRLSVQPFLMWLERFLVSRESLWFDENFIYVFSWQKLAARYKFEQILSLEATKTRINSARIWRIRFAQDGLNLDEKTAQNEAPNFTNGEPMNSARISPPDFKISGRCIGASEAENDANKFADAASEYKFTPAASIFTPNFKEFLQILREKNPDAIKTKPKFWESV